MRLPGWIQRAWSPQVHAGKTSTRKQVIVGVFWWSGLAGIVLLSMTIAYEGSVQWDAAGVGLGIAVALFLRHTVPIAALLTVVALETWASALLEHSAAAWPVLMMFSLFILSYLVGRSDNSTHPMVVQLGAVCVLLMALGPLFGVRLLEWVSLTIALTFSAIFPWLVGRYRYQHAELMTNGWQRAEQLEREQRAVADQARLRERTRIAEDMHDSLGHELSLIALRAAALEVDRELPDRHQSAAGELRRSAAIATERLREIIGLLRDSGESASVTPVDEGIGELVARARESGMDIALHLDETTPLPRMVDRAAYRVVQEALTNAAKHAPGKAVSIRVEREDSHSTITVVNDLSEGEDTPSGIGGRRGLIGLTERVRLAGGALKSGPSGGRFEVAARLPHTVQDVLPDSPETTPDTESAQQHVEVRRRARRRLITVFAMPLVLMAVLGVVSATLYIVGSLYSVLPPEDFEKLHVGQSRESASEILPTFEMLNPPEWVGEPDSADYSETVDCVYYPAYQELDVESDVYQLCFAGDRLIFTRTITTQERQ